MCIHIQQWLFYWGWQRRNWGGRIHSNDETHAASKGNVHMKRLLCIISAQRCYVNWDWMWILGAIWSTFWWSWLWAWNPRSSKCFLGMWNFIPNHLGACIQGMWHSVKLILVSPQELERLMFDLGTEMPGSNTLEVDIRGVWKILHYRCALKKVGAAEFGIASS